MNWRKDAGGLAASLAAAAFAAAGPVSAQTGSNAPTRAVSVSRQFVAYANQPLLAHAVGVVAERVKRGWLDVMDVPDTWRDPIVILVQPREGPWRNAPRTALEIFGTELHLKYQIRCVTPPLLTEPELATAVVEALCAEAAHRSLPISRTRTAPFPAVPAWLVEGLTQSIQGKTDLLRVVARRSVLAGRPCPASDLLETPAAPADPLERELFRANCWLFTEGLRSLSQGPRKLMRYLDGLDGAGSATNAFWTVYRADFPRPVVLEKWWSLQLAERTAMRVASDLTAAESGRQLDEILTTRVTMPGAGGGTPGHAVLRLDELGPYGGQAWLQSLLQYKEVALESLRIEAHPAYRTVVDRYLEAVGQLLQDRIRRFRLACRKADRARRDADHTARQVSDYLDAEDRVYEPTDLSRMMTNYQHTVEESRDLLQRHRGAIREYLDRFDP